MLLITLTNIFEPLYIYQANLLPLLVLIIILISLRFNKEHSVRESRSFRAMVLLTIFLLLSDILMYIAMQGQSNLHIFLNKLINVLAFMALPYVTLCWILYIFREINYRIIKNPLYLIALLIPAAVSTILAIGSAFTNLYFWIGPDNVYIRGLLFPLHATIPYLYMLIGVVIIVYSRKRLPPREFLPMLLFVLPPTIAGVLQSVFYGTLLLFPSIMISLLLIFIFNQSRQVMTDYLTGLNNRREYDRFIENIKIKVANNVLAGMLLDLDDFKFINDTYGHFVGDEVLVAMSRIINETFSQNDFVARTGGDEFFIFFNINDQRPVNTLIQTFISNVNRYNQTKHFPFDIKCSYGVDVFNIDTHHDLRFFIAHIDQMMYAQKHKNHAENGLDK